MSLDINKKDFEGALEEMINAVKTVVDEYNVHYLSNIEDLISENENLQEKVDELESRDGPE